MIHCQKDPLHPLTNQERHELERLSPAQAAERCRTITQLDL